MAKRTLGRGLHELLSGHGEMASLIAPTNPVSETPRQLPIDALRPGKYQPRKEMQQETLQELASSIRAQGVLQPLLVRQLGAAQYEIIAGERRWRAAQLAQLEYVPVFVRDISDEMAMAMGLIENIQREDLNPLEQAEALKRLGEEFQLTHEQIATAVGKSRVSVTNLLRLLQLDKRVLALLAKRQLDMGHARALLALQPAQQVMIAQQIITKDLSVRATEALVRQVITPPPTKPPAMQMDPDVMRLQAQLSDKIGALVRIQHSKKGKGKLLIHYHSLDELDGILERIG